MEVRMSEKMAWKVRSAVLVALVIPAALVAGCSSQQPAPPPAQAQTYAPPPPPPPMPAVRG